MLLDQNLVLLSWYYSLNSLVVLEPLLSPSLMIATLNVKTL